MHRAILNFLVSCYIAAVGIDKTDPRYSPPSIQDLKKEFFAKQCPTRSSDPKPVPAALECLQRDFGIKLEIGQSGNTVEEVLSTRENPVVLSVLLEQNLPYISFKCGEKFIVFNIDRDRVYIMTSKTTRIPLTCLLSRIPILNDQGNLSKWIDEYISENTVNSIPTQQPLNRLATQVSNVTNRALARLMGIFPEEH